MTLYMHFRAVVRWFMPWEDISQFIFAVYAVLLGSMSAIAVLQGDIARAKDTMSIYFWLLGMMTLYHIGATILVISLVILSGDRREKWLLLRMEWELWGSKPFFVEFRQQRACKRASIRFLRENGFSKSAAKQAEKTNRFAYRN